MLLQEIGPEIGPSDVTERIVIEDAKNGRTRAQGMQNRGAKELRILRRRNVTIPRRKQGERLDGERRTSYCASEKLLRRRRPQLSVPGRSQSSSHHGNVSGTERTMPLGTGIVARIEENLRTRERENATTDKLNDITKRPRRHLIGGRRRRRED